MQKYTVKIAVVIAIGLMSLITACSTSEVMKFSILSYSVKVVDTENHVIPNAMVSSTDGQRIATNKDGVAKLKFSIMGAHQISVNAPNYQSSRFKITMPLDQGKSKTIKLAKVSSIPDAAKANININIDIGANFSGMFMSQMYPIMFQSMFSAYGYNMEFEAYKPGQWTEWAYQTDDKPVILKKAFLKRTGDKKQWWQMTMKGEKETFVMEVLFSANRQSILRMRQKEADGKIVEVPVTKSWYTPPNELTPESIEGATVKRNTKIKVPAGSFSADLVEFAAMGTSGKLRLWRTKKVPGGIVKSEIVDNENTIEWKSELKAYGEGAHTLLNSYK